MYPYVPLLSPPCMYPVHEGYKGSGRFTSTPIPLWPIHHSSAPSRAPGPSPSTHWPMVVLNSAAQNFPAHFLPKPHQPQKVYATGPVVFSSPLPQATSPLFVDIGFFLCRTTSAPEYFPRQARRLLRAPLPIGRFVLVFWHAHHPQIAFPRPVSSLLPTKELSLLRQARNLYRSSLNRPQVSVVAFFERG